MIALSCILLVLCVIGLMVVTGVGPFSQAPWEKYHFAYKKMDRSIQALILYPSILFTIICSMVLIGAIS